MQNVASVVLVVFVKWTLDEYFDTPAILLSFSLWLSQQHYFGPHLSLECLIGVVKAINHNHLVLGCILGVDLNKRGECVDAKVPPVVGG